MGNFIAGDFMDMQAVTRRPMGRFWGDSSSSDSDSSGSESETESEDVASNRSTPRGARPFVDNPMDPQYDIGRKERQWVKDFIDPSTYHGCPPKKVRSLRARALKKIVLGYDYEQIPTHVKVVDLIKNGGGWVKAVFQYAESRGPFVNFAHLTVADGKGGWHFCKQEEIGASLSNTSFNNGSGVFTGWFEHKGEPKFSSFFPTSVAPVDLINFFSRATPILRNGNRALFAYPYGQETSFYIEAYYRENQLVVQSAFPILHVMDFSDNWSFTFRGTTISHWDVPLVMQEEEKRRKAKQFETSTHVIIDLAKMFALQGVTSGVYLKVNKDEYFLA